MLKNKVILGLNAFHADSSAAIIIDDEIIAAAEEERFNRKKHWSGFPLESIKFCLQKIKQQCLKKIHLFMVFSLA